MNIQKSIEKLELQLSFWGILKRFISAYVVIAGGVFLLYFKINPHHNFIHLPYNTNTDPFSFALPLFIFLFGALLYFVADDLLKLTPLISYISTEKKRGLIKSAMHKMGLNLYSEDQRGVFSFRLYRGTMHFPQMLDITLLFDEKGIYINVTDDAKRYLFKKELYQSVTFQVKSALEKEIATSDTFLLNITT